MSLLEVREINAHAKLGIWEITETADDLKWALQWGQEDIKRYQALNDRQRSLHWLASRVLLRQMSNTPDFIDLQSDENGKPYIKNQDVELSISHSGDRVAVLIADKPCGVDIQHISRRMDILAHKFISEQEKQEAFNVLSSLQLYVFWSAKESLYKLYGRKRLDFKVHLYIYPFEDSACGKIRGRIEKEGFRKSFDIYFERIDDYMLAYTLDK